MISIRRYARLPEHKTKPHIFWDAGRGIWVCTNKGLFISAASITHCARLNAYKGKSNRLARFYSAWVYRQKEQNA